MCCLQVNMLSGSLQRHALSSGRFRSAVSRAPLSSSARGPSGGARERWNGRRRPQNFVVIASKRLRSITLEKFTICIQSSNTYLEISQDLSPDLPWWSYAEVLWALPYSRGLELWSPVHLQIWAAHEIPSSVWQRILKPSGISRVPGRQSQEAFASWTTSSSLKPTKVLRFSIFVSSRHISMTSVMFFIVSSIVSPQEWQPLNWGQLTIYKPSSSISIRMGKCSFSICVSTIFSFDLQT